MSEQNDLITLTNLNAHQHGRLVLNNLTISFGTRECWAIMGPTGSGKTSLIRVLAGQLPVQPGMITRRQQTSFVSFREDSRQFSYSSHFYQQRYQATLSDEGPTLRTFMQFTDSAENTALVRRLGLEPLLDMSFLKLSNGQTRKARIGRALMQHPAILLLDNPFVGLDAAFRAELTDWLGDLVRHGLTLIWVVEPDEIPPFVNQVIILKQGQIKWTGPRKQFVAEMPVEKSIAPPSLVTSTGLVNFTDVFRLTNITIRYGEQILLNDITWTVRAGERWALLGSNGAGKSILLSLLYGDHPQAYANDIQIFGYRRGYRGAGPSQSVWDVKRRIGFVSPELHLYFPQHLSVRQVIFSGLTDTQTVPARVPPEAISDLAILLDYFGVSTLTERPFGTLSAGEQRLILFVRALIKNPPVLILDEPFQVMDAQHVLLARLLIDSMPDKTILFVSHNRQELPQSINKFFVLKSGKSYTYEEN